MIFASYFKSPGVPASCDRKLKVINDTQPAHDQLLEAARFGRRHSHHSFILYEGHSTTECVPLTQHHLISAIL